MIIPRQQKTSARSHIAAGPTIRNCPVNTEKKYRPPKANFGYGYGGTDFVNDDEDLDEDDRADEDYQVSFKTDVMKGFTERIL